MWLKNRRRRYKETPWWTDDKGRCKEETHGGSGTVTELMLRKRKMDTT
jgi:hypothetical protein